MKSHNMILIVVMLLITCIGVVSAADVNDTDIQENEVIATQLTSDTQLISDLKTDNYQEYFKNKLSNNKIMKDNSENTIHINNDNYLNYLKYNKMVNEPNTDNTSSILLNATNGSNTKYVFDEVLEGVIRYDIIGQNITLTSSEGVVFKNVYMNIKSNNILLENITVDIDSEYNGESTIIQYTDVVSANKFVNTVFNNISITSNTSKNLKLLSANIRDDNDYDTFTLSNSTIIAYVSAREYNVDSYTFNHVFNHDNSIIYFSGKSNIYNNKIIVNESYTQKADNKFLLPVLLSGFDDFYHNIIQVNAKNDVYALSIKNNQNNLFNINIRNNNICINTNRTATGIISSSVDYAYELKNVRNIFNNNINITADLVYVNYYTQSVGINLFNQNNTQVYNNKINVTNGVGINIVDSNNMTVINNEILTTEDYTIELYSLPYYLNDTLFTNNNNRIKYNKLSSRNIHGSQTVRDNGNNSISDNYAFDEVEDVSVPVLSTDTPSIITHLLDNNHKINSNNISIAIENNYDDKLLPIDVYIDGALIETINKSDNFQYAYNLASIEDIGNRKIKFVLNNKIPCELEVDVIVLDNRQEIEFSVEQYQYPSHTERYNEIMYTNYSASYDVYMFNMSDVLNVNINVSSNDLNNLDGLLYQVYDKDELIKTGTINNSHISFNHSFNKIGIHPLTIDVNTTTHKGHTYLLFRVYNDEYNIDYNNNSYTTDILTYVNLKGTFIKNNYGIANKTLHAYEDGILVNETMVSRYHGFYSSVFSDTYTTTDNGNFVYYYTPTSVGLHNITIKTTDDEEITYWVDVKKRSVGLIRQVGQYTDIHNYPGKYDSNQGFIFNHMLKNTAISLDWYVDGIFKQNILMDEIFNLNEYNTSIDEIGTHNHTFVVNDEKYEYSYNITLTLTVEDIRLTDQLKNMTTNMNISFNSTLNNQIDVEETININGTVSSEGVKLTNITIDVYGDDNRIGSITTDENGNYYYNYTSSYAQDHNITLIINDTDYKGRNSKIISVNKIHTTFPKKDVVYANYTKGLSKWDTVLGRLHNEYTYNSYIDGIRYETLKASDWLLVPEIKKFTLDDIGNHTIIYEMDDYKYTADNLTFTLIVQDDRIQIDFINETDLSMMKVVNNSFIITGQLVFDEFNILSQMEYLVYDNDNLILNSTTDINGQYYLEYNSTSLGKHNITFLVNDTDYAGSKTYTVNVVEKLEPILLIPHSGNETIKEGQSFNMLFMGAYNNQLYVLKDFDVYENGLKIATITSSNVGVVNYTVTPPLGTSQYTFKTEYEEAYGEISFTVTVIEKDDDENIVYNYVHIINDNYKQFFGHEEDELFLSEEVYTPLNNTVFIFDEDINDVSLFNLEDTQSQYNIIITSTVEFKNKYINIETQQNSIKLENITIRNDDSFENSYVINYNSPIKSTMKNISIFQNLPTTSEQRMLITVKNVKIDNLTIASNMAAGQVSWDANGLSPNVAIKTSGNTTIENSNIFIQQQGNDNTPNPSIFGVSISGQNNNFINNNLTLNGENWLYALRIGSINSTIANNNITVESVNYSAGIFLSGTNYHNNVVDSNTLNLTAGMYATEGVPENVVYGIVIENFGYSGGKYYRGVGNVRNNTISNNNLTATGYNVYALEQFGGDASIFTGNSINITAVTPMAIGIIGSSTKISDNNITLVGQTNKTLSSADYLKPRTSGIYLYAGDSAYVINNNINSTNGRAIDIEYSNSNRIENNNATVYDYVYAVDIESGSDNTVINNNLKAEITHGQTSVNYDGNNTVENNTPTPVMVIIEQMESPSEVALGDEYSMEFITATNEGQYLPYRQYIVYEDSVKIGMVESDIMGRVFYTIEAATIGEHNYTFALNDYHYIANTTFLFNVTESENILINIVTDRKVYVGQEVLIKANITDDNQIPLSDVNVKFYLGDELLGENITNENGMALFTFIPTDSQIKSEQKIIVIVNDKSNDTIIDIDKIEPPVKPVLKVDTVKFTTGSISNITATIYLGDKIASDINRGKITFKVNGKTLKDANGKTIYVKVRGGVATIENYIIPSSWNKNNTTIQATYIGSGDISSLKSEKTIITIIKSEPSIKTCDVITTMGDTITLSADIIDGDNVINKGKVVFKINGKSVKDENGKVIYAKVVNNKVNVQYVLPMSYKTGSYNITAVFLSPDYDRLEDYKKLTVN